MLGRVAHVAHGVQNFVMLALHFYFKCKTLEDSSVTILTFKWQKIPAVVLLSFFLSPLLYVSNENSVVKERYRRAATRSRFDVNYLKICFIKENEDG